MVWFSEDTVTSSMCLRHMLKSLGDPVVDEDEGQATGLTPKKGSREGEEKKEEGDSGSSTSPTQLAFIAAVRPYFISSLGDSSSLVSDMLSLALTLKHIMPPTRGRLLTTLSCLLQRGIDQAIEYDENHIDFPMAGEHMSGFAKKHMLHSLLWSFAGSCGWAERTKFGEALVQASGITLPGGGEGLASFRVNENDGEFEPWENSVPKMEIDSSKVTATDVVITTTDTVRHVDVLTAWLSTRRPLILCGPPGSGKTMTLTSTLQALPDIVLAPLNFSSGTTPDLILKTFHQHCEYVRARHSAPRTN
jgi:dynein heavy chain 1